MKDITDYSMGNRNFNVRKDVIDKNIVRIDCSSGSEQPPGILPGNSKPLMKNPDRPVGVLPVSPTGMSSDARAKFMNVATAPAKKIYGDVAVKRGGNSLATKPHGANRPTR